MKKYYCFISFLLLLKPLSDLKQHKCIVFCGSSEGQKSKKGPQECVPSGGSVEFHSLSLPASRGLPTSLAHGPVPPS